MKKMIVGGLAAGGVGVAACAALAGSWLLGVGPAHADASGYYDSNTAAYIDVARMQPEFNRFSDA
jgi:hypothetical protein